MNSEERLNLQKMIKANDVEDQTNLIRQTKHSELIRTQVKDMLALKTKFARLAKSNPLILSWVLSMSLLPAHKSGALFGNFSMAFFKTSLPLVKCAKSLSAAM